ncbi:FAD-binding protein [Acetobacter sp. LMG 1636]|uniref:FAD-binding protein n=2 Tax=Acetobacter fallax TaxID=1737473 RepID=A0ABX0KAC2_9PROT|nr:FAD-binding protein [Acetobacter fallax]NHO35799.1 FAD-binding protein [Acetobacter fallax]
MRPTKVEDVASVVKDAVLSGHKLEIRGNGTRTGYGNPVQADTTLELGGLDQIEFYEPEELVIRLGPGVTMQSLQATIAERGQYLPFEPPFWTSLYGTDPARATIGGTMASALSGPRRLFTGAARDYILGIEGINGQGEHFVAGGRTVKNVTGYDVSKLMVGSFGTIAALTSLTLKLWPAPPREQTLLFEATDLAADLARTAEILRAPIAVSGATRLETPQGWQLAFRIEGMEEGVAEHVAELTRRMARPVAATLDDKDSAALWASIRELDPLNATPDDLIWRVNLPVSQAKSFIDAAGQGGGLSRYFTDWGGAEIFCATKPETATDAGVTRLRALAKASSGHATLVRAPDALRRSQGAFPPASAAVAALSARVRKAFDPMGLFNPGRMTVAGQGSKA